MNPNRKRPPTLGHMILYPLIRLVFWLNGWRAKGEMPKLPKFVLLFSPHTSYVDNYILSAVQACYGFEGYWLAADKLFKNPIMRRFLMWGGARPVDRRQSNKLVEQYSKAFEEHEYMVLGMAPAGTRKKRDTWKSGFYWIALQADVPIVCLSIDYKTRRLEIGPTVYPTGDIYGDMEPIAAFYAGKVGRRPERQTPVELQAGLDAQYGQKAS